MRLIQISLVRIHTVIKHPNGTALKQCSTLVVQHSSGTTLYWCSTFNNAPFSLRRFCGATEMKWQSPKIALKPCQCCTSILTIAGAIFLWPSEIFHWATMAECWAISCDVFFSLGQWKYVLYAAFIAEWNFHSPCVIFHLPSKNSTGPYTFFAGRQLKIGWCPMPSKVH